MAASFSCRCIIGEYRERLFEEIKRCPLLRDRDLRAKALLIFGAGLASRFVMGLSPTLFASGERTFLFCDFALLALSLLFFTTARLPCKSYVVWGAVAMRLMLCCGKFA